MNQQSDFPPISVILAVDGPSPRYLAPYGCTWIETPVLNQLAANSVVFENAIADSIDVQAGLRALLTGVHPHANKSDPRRGDSALAAIRETVTCVLLSDDLNRFDSELLELFDEAVALPDVSVYARTARTADHLADTHLGHCFAQVLSELTSRDLPLFCLVHLGSMTRIWDAPMEMRTRFCEEDDPLPGQWVIPPEQLAGAPNTDPDEVLGITRAIAAQIECFDLCLGSLLDVLESQQLLDSALLAVIGLRAFPTGHHGVVGCEPQHLLSDTIDVPLMIQFPKSHNPGGWRDHDLIQPSSALSWLLAQFKRNGDPLQTFEHRQAPPLVVVTGDQSHAVRTAAWLLYEDREHSQLFVKPDDRWDINPVQDRCQDIVQLLHKVRNDILAAIHRGDPIFSGPQLAPELLGRSD
jgi:hypothetical protein